MASRLLKCSTIIFLCSKKVSKEVNWRNVITSSRRSRSTTVDTEEVKKFDSTSNEWWNGKKYEMLHLFNSLRVPLIRDGILSVSKRSKNVSDPLAGYRILDVGCGGGILSEPLARLGAEVTGLDPGAQNIEIAREHAAKDPEISERLNYICDTIENLTTSDSGYDTVVSSEVVEHVKDVQTFVHSCVELTKSNGSLFFTTINRTNLSYFLSIIMAEYVMGLIPRGTHEWNKFVKPDELIAMLESMNCRIVSVEGITYNPIAKKFSWCKNSENWYALHAVKL